MYLALEVNASQIHARFSTHATPETNPIPLGLRLRGYHPLRRSFPEHFDFIEEGAVGPIHHILANFRWRVQFRLFPFRSPLLRKSQLVSLPPPTKMFQFGGFPLLTEQRPKPLGSPIQVSSDLRLHASTRGLSQLATPFIGTQAKPSTRQRSISANSGPTVGV